MDQAVIQTPGLRIRSEVIERTKRVNDFLSQGGRYQLNTNVEGGKTWLSIKFGPQVGARLVVRKEEDYWKCNRIHLFLPRWLWGHNGHVVSDHEDFLHALNRYYEIASQLVEPGHAHRVLPGIGQENSSHWSSIEFPIHVADPDSRLLRAFENIHHSGIRNPISITRGRNVTLSGTSLTIKAYAKGRQLGTSFLPSIPEPILRIEVRWAEEVLQHAISTARPNFPKGTREALGDKRVTSFSLETLYAAFLGTLRDTEGVFLREPLPDNTSFVPALLALLAARANKLNPSTDNDIGCSLRELELLMQATGLRSDRRIRGQIGEARKILGMMSEFSLADLFPQSLPRCQPYFENASERDEFDKLCLPEGPIMQAIREKYHDENCNETTYWRPGPPVLSNFRNLSHVKDALPQLQKDVLITSA